VIYAAHVKHLSVHGIQLAYVDTGAGSTGETVVMSHGLLFDRDLFRHQIEHLRSRYRVIAYDHRGQGASDDDPRPVIGMELVTDDALALMTALETGPAHFVGLSMGGFVGMRIAARWPERVRSLVLMNTSAEGEPARNAPKYRALAEIARFFGGGRVARRVSPIMLGKTTLRDPSRAHVVAELHERARSMRRTIGRAVRGVIERENVLHLLEKIRVPTTVIVGAEDVATTPDKGERIHRGVLGSRLVVLEGAGHSSAIEVPDAVNAALDAHLRR
jgi:pimeloyl-ACP methyl ester carboxylesterase